MSTDWSQNLNRNSHICFFPNEVFQMSPSTIDDAAAAAADDDDDDDDDDDNDNDWLVVWNIF